MQREDNSQRGWALTWALLVCCKEQLRIILMMERCWFLMNVSRLISHFRESDTECLGELGKA